MKQCGEAPEHFICYTGRRQATFQGDHVISRKEEQRPVHLVRATADDAGQLTVVQGCAFLDDRKWMPKDILSLILTMDDPQPGPPGCTSVEWNRRAIENERVTYYKILLGDRIVGGLILFDNGGGEWELGRIYIDPDYQNRAIGQQALLKMYQLHSDVKRWRLGTPEWATRNRHFYQKMGFTVLEVTALDPNLGWRSVEYENTLSVGIGDQQIDQLLTDKDDHPSVEATAV